MLPSRATQNTAPHGRSVVSFVVAVVMLRVVQPMVVSAVEHQHVFSDSFPRNDEYDFMALEPGTPYGTPYGGFSRATASRLAALPLRLPSVSSDEKVAAASDATSDFADVAVDDEPLYAMVRDHFGRRYACRSYYEDELESDSLNDSIFDTARLKTSNSSRKNNPSSSKNSNEKKLQTETTAAAAAASSSSSSSSSTKLSELGFDPIMVGHTIHQRLTKLTGLCAQLHPSSWWSYEWCHQESIKQFHVNVRRNKDGVIQKFELEHITSLGSFSKRAIEVATSDSNYKYEKVKGQIKDLAQGRQEIGRVVDTFIGGDICTETGQPRVTEATFRCCSKQHLAQNKGGVLKDGNQVDTDIISVFDASEDSKKVCHYNITLCTPLLCDDYDDGAGSSSALYKTGGEKTKSNAASWDDAVEKANAHQQRQLLNLDLDPSEAETMSVVEILEHTFGTSGNFCIRAQTVGWWSYEFCPGEYVRQYHEDEPSAMDAVSAVVAAFQQKDPKAKKKGVTEHYLGRYFPEDHTGVTRENEWQHVVDATAATPTSSSTGKSGMRSSDGSKQQQRTKQATPSTSAGGNGAYYFQEYTGGDICDHEDVTDSAIKAGEFGEGGIERAITVRYSCNSHLSIKVKEDSTCHYIADITVPTLCHHPLFRAPVSKKKVVKCIPVTNKV